MYEILLIAHSAWRWVVLLTGGATLVFVIIGSIQSKPWREGPARSVGLFSLALDIQVLIGASLYLVFSPVTNEAAAIAGALPSGSDLGFVSSTHAIYMFAAFLIVHVSSAIIKRLKSDRAQYASATAMYCIVLLLLLFAIPWWRPLLRH